MTVRSSLSVSVVVPTYQEAGNVSFLIERMAEVRERFGLDVELLLCDDDSRDGTAEAVLASGRPWVRLVIRHGERGLSSAVVHGIRAARHDRLVVMDADLSHPPERIPDLLAALDKGADLALGSRYVPGARVEEGWGIRRWVNSRVAAWLARPLTGVRDPLAGFFALDRSTFNRAVGLDPVGYKIALELIVKCGCRRVAEIPICFSDRKVGRSKLGLGQQIRYLEHLRRLFLYRYFGGRGEQERSALPSIQAEGRAESPEPLMASMIKDV